MIMVMATYQNSLDFSYPILLYHFKLILRITW